MSARAWTSRVVGRIRVRLLVVNLLVLLVPVAGLELARIHERQLNASLERGMKDQSAIVRAVIENELERGVPLDDPAHEAVLTRAARSTRTRVRLLDARGQVVVDTHANGPPEGPEPPPPSMLPDGARDVGDRVPSVRQALRARTVWPDVPERNEVQAALAGRAATYTRIREKRPGVFFFVAEPLRDGAGVIGAVYTVRSTQPVLVELYQIRSSLFRLLAGALFFSALVTLLLAWSISQPLEKLSRAAKRVAAGEPGVVVPIGGGGEIRDLGEAFAAMKERLDARLRYISDFAADVAHEFKSPLTSIRGAAELLGEGAADDPEARHRFLRNIELDVARLDRLVSRLLELSRIEASSEALAEVDLEALLQRVTERSGGITLRVRCRNVRVLARETDLETALMNLVENAVKFSPPAAPVEVTVDELPGAVEIRVADQGPGIPAAHLPKIFDRFFTTDKSRDGTGLGLSIVRAVARAHGGEVTVVSRAQGAEFLLRLPLWARHPRASERA
jgi:two-component system, OmpR family, sensor histidine kinase ChvG